MAQTTSGNSFTPLKGNIFVTDLEAGMQKTKGGIILRDDNMKDHGIKPRWCRVWRTGPDIDYLEPGEWLYVEHGRWTLRLPLDLPEGKIDVWKIDPAAILLVSDQPDRPTDYDTHAL
jgi:hypothetical protein